MDGNRQDHAMYEDVSSYQHFVTRRGTVLVELDRAL
jgi:hypothetical protein